MPSNFPYPTGSSNGELLDWAQKLVRALTSEGDSGLVRLEGFALAVRLPDATKVRDGSVIFVKDAAGGGVPVYSRGGQWLRFDDNTVVV